jgi:hypothetical protein
LKVKSSHLYLAALLSVLAYTPVGYAQWWNPLAKSTLPNCPSDKSARFHNCFGEISFPDGTRYIGEFKDDTFHGRGLGIRPDGTRYSGEYVNGKRNGDGIEYSADKKVLQSGKWKDGILASPAKLDPSKYAFETKAERTVAKADKPTAKEGPKEQGISKNSESIEGKLAQTEIKDELEFLKSLKKEPIFAGLLQYNVSRQSDGSGTLSLPEYRRLCSIAQRNNNATFAGIATCFSVFDEAYEFTRKGGSSVIQSYKVFWDESGQACRLRATVGGVKDGNSFGRSTTCRVFGFVVKDDGEVLASSSSDLN